MAEIEAISRNINNLNTIQNSNSELQKDYMPLVAAQAKEMFSGVKNNKFLSWVKSNLATFNLITADIIASVPKKAGNLEVVYKSKDIKPSDIKAGTKKQTLTEIKKNKIASRITNSNGIPGFSDLTSENKKNFVNLLNYAIAMTRNSAWENDDLTGLVNNVKAGISAENKLTDKIVETLVAKYEYNPKNPDFKSKDKAEISYNKSKEVIIRSLEVSQGRAAA